MKRNAHLAVREQNTSRLLYVSMMGKVLALSVRLKSPRNHFGNFIVETGKANSTQSSGGILEDTKRVENDDDYIMLSLLSTQTRECHTSATHTRSKIAALGGYQLLLVLAYLKLTMYIWKAYLTLKILPWYWHLHWDGKTHLFCLFSTIPRRQKHPGTHATGRVCTW